MLQLTYFILFLIDLKDNLVIATGDLSDYSGLSVHHRTYFLRFIISL
jgi:hypothetical protein